MIRLVVATAVALVAATLVVSGAQAQDYPRRAIRLISPNPPGGANDTVARIVADKMGEILGQRLVIDNRGGAGGTIGGELAAHAAPDGYTLLAGSVSTHTFAPLIQPKLGYDPVADFAPISLFAVVPNLLVVNAELPVGSVAELIAMAKARSGKFDYASGGPGSTSHFAVAMFVAVAGITNDTLHIPFKGGSPAIAATMAGDTQFYFGPIPGMVPLLKSGHIRALAVSGPRRATALPDVPTVAETGLPGYQSSGWFGLLAPAGTPSAVVTRLGEAVAAAVASDDVRHAFALQSIEPESDSPAEFAAFIRDRLELYRRLVKEQGLKLD